MAITRGRAAQTEEHTTLSWWTTYGRCNISLVRTRTAGSDWQSQEDEQLRQKNMQTQLHCRSGLLLDLSTSCRNERTEESSSLNCAIESGLQLDYFSAFVSILKASTSSLRDLFYDTRPVGCFSLFTPCSLLRMLTLTHTFEEQLAHVCIANINFDTVSSLIP